VDFASLLLTNVTHFLKNDFISLEDGRINLYGARFKSYWTSWLMTGRDHEAQTDWTHLTKSCHGKILDILVTHQPPNFKKEISNRFFRRGSDSLRDAVEVVKPKVHIFGHNHDVYGVKYAMECNEKMNIDTTFISACSVDSYERMRKVIVLD